ncbi:hypothetical protein PsYK624_014230 [Phanerochaete sordida]|uniref:Uncharacterized protein n=1 Tax=Phanerochaete sordida TaxID=48140 RepID=A0A9P3L8B7_9APHY|nr:hypothetical protein PsYK624_014230 [Phanerochaete sordida]
MGAEMSMATYGLYLYGVRPKTRWITVVHDSRVRVCIAAELYRGQKLVSTRSDASSAAHVAYGFMTPSSSR